MKAKIGLGVLVVLLAALFTLANPLNLFVKKSHRFTEEAFDSVKIGMQKEELVKLLGEPLKITEIRTPYYRCENCSIYYFMGDPPEWLVSYEEAWVYVGPEGTVREKIWNAEP